MKRRNNKATGCNSTLKRPLDKVAPVQDGLLSSLLVIPFLAGCATGGGGGPGAGAVDSTNLALSETRQIESVPEPSRFNVLSGKAINGYLDLALVFIDLNQDGLLSEGEPLTISRNGNFSIIADDSPAIVVAALQSLNHSERNVAASQLLTLGIDLNDSPITSYDSEGLFKPFTGRLEVSSPNNLDTVNVTPLTSLSASLQRGVGLSASQAEELIQDKFGVKTSEDYLAVNNLSAQRLSQALSDFYQISHESLDADGPSQQTMDSLSRNLLRSINSSDASTNQLLSSPVDLRSVLLSTAFELRRELDISAVNVKLNQAFQDRDVGLDSPVLRLRSDTGFSQLDGLTSNPTILDARANDPLYPMTYGVSLGALDPLGTILWSTVQWYDEDPTAELLDGRYRIYVTESENQGQSGLPFVEFILDKTAPIGRLTASNVFKQSEQIYFEEYIPGFLNTLIYSDEHISTLKTEVDVNERIQYLVSADEKVSHDNASWADNINVYAHPDQERSFYLSTRITDLAGNVSDISSARFRIDQFKPLTPDISLVRPILDTGIYDWDNYSQTVSLTDFILSLRIGDSPYDHELIYAINYSLEDNVKVDEVLSFDSLEDGAYEINFRQVDRSDNFSDVVSFQFVLDRTPPALDARELSWLPSGYTKPLMLGGPTNSFDEWGQYGYREFGVDSDFVWLNYGRPVENTDFDIQFRLIDRAGNYSAIVDTGRHQLKAPLLSLSKTQSDDLLIVLKSELALDSELLALSFLDGPFQSFYIQRDFSMGGASDQDAPFVTRRGLSVATNGLFAGAIETSSLSDSVNRRQLLLESEDFFVYGDHAEATEFFSSPEKIRSSILLVGGQGSDLFGDLKPGDIFLGAGGIDLVMSKSELNPVGLAFLSESEKVGLQSIVAGGPVTVPREVGFDGTYMVYLSGPGTGNEGIAITNAEIFAYKDSSEFFTIHYNGAFRRYFFVHDALDNEFFYGGSDTGALGLGGSDVLQGGKGNDFLVGGSAPLGGEDVLYGHGGNDILVGGDYQTYTFSKYTLLGGDGDDSLFLGNGSGTAVGGPGRDVFHIAPIPLSDVNMSLTIQDFNPSDDKIIFHFEGISTITNGIFISRDTEEVIIDLAKLFLSRDGKSSSVSTLDSLLVIQVDGLGDVGVDEILQDWFVFENAHSEIWSQLADGWVSFG